MVTKSAGFLPAESSGRAWCLSRPSFYPLLSSHFGSSCPRLRCVRRGLPAGCFCDGALKGYDDPDTRALCLSEALCLELCAGLPDCVSVDMHTMVNRCFLNEGTVRPLPVTHYEGARVRAGEICNGIFCEQNVLHFILQSLIAVPKEHVFNN